MAIPIPAKRISDFENLGFGIFIHWGLYSQLAQGEWIEHIAKIPKEEYRKLFNTFTAAKFDARAIARLAREAGAKYITLTTRHHEGFSLYDTCGLNEFDAPHSPAGRDLIAEFCEGCRAEGIMPFFYHTTLDWDRDDFDGDFESYLEYLRRSVEILCTKYGKIGGLWFDGNWSKKGADWQEDKLYSLIRRHQPDAIIVNNTGLHALGALGHPEIDSVTFEQGRPEPMNREGMAKYLAAESCMTLNRHWGYCELDYNYKSLAYLIETLCSCRKIGANFLLNIGPRGEGDVDPMQAAMLQGIGGWIRATGNVIYTAKPTSIKGEGKNFALRDGNKLYFFIHDLSASGDANVTVAGGGAGEKLFSGVFDKIKSIKWIDNGEQLVFTQNGDALTLGATGFAYGRNLVVRVAEAEIE